MDLKPQLCPDDKGHHSRLAVSGHIVNRPRLALGGFPVARACPHFRSQRTVIDTADRFRSTQTLPPAGCVMAPNQRVENSATIDFSPECGSGTWGPFWLQLAAPERCPPTVGLFVEAGAVVAPFSTARRLSKWRNVFALMPVEFCTARNSYVYYCYGVASYAQCAILRGDEWLAGDGEEPAIIPEGSA